MAVIDHLDAMDRAALRTAWEEAVGQPSPLHASDDYMRSVLAYRIQEESGPRLSKATKRELERIARALENGRSPAPTPQLKAGTKLVREWNGVTHEAHVVDDGFEYGDVRYESLSAVAREITGARWSGPRFFGLNEKEKADAQ